MLVKIEKEFTLDMKSMREYSYKEYGYDGVDLEDAFWKDSNKYYVNAYEEDRLIGTSRFIGRPMPFEKYFTGQSVSDHDYELGRLCIVGSNPLIKYKILVELIKKVICLGLVLNANDIYTGAKPPGDLIYTALAGFKEVEIPAAAYPPASNKEIIMLKLNMKSEYEASNRSKFKATKEQLLEVENILKTLNNS